MTTQTDSPRISQTAGRRAAIAAIFALLALHAFQATRLFPTLASIVDPSSPVVVVDHAIHEYHGSLGANFFRQHATTWGYDPFFMAGYPETPVWDSSSNPSIAFNLLGGDNFRSYKVGLFVASILVLAAVAGGASATGLGAAEVAVAMLLAWFVFWTGFPFVLWQSGLFAFVSASSGIGLLLGLCVLFDRRPSRMTWLLLTAVAAGLFFVHVTTPIMVAGGALAFYATVARRHGRRWHMAVWGALALTVALNLFWLVPLWQFRTIRSGSGQFMTANSAWFLWSYYTASTIDGRSGLILICAGLAGLTRWWFRGRRPAAAAFGGSIFTLLLLIGFGSVWGPTQTLEPLRFRVALHLLLAVPAGSMIAGVVGWAVRRVGGGRRGAVIIAVGVAGILAAWGSLDRGVFQASYQLLMRHRPLVVGFSPEMTGMAGWIRANTDISARILFEDQLRLLEETDRESVHWTPLLPFLLRPDARLFIGGLYQTAFIRHHAMAAFGDFQLGDRPIDEWSDADLKRYCDRYNVGWIVCWSPLSRYRFDRFGPATRVATLSRFVTPNRPVSTNEHEWTAMIAGAGLNTARRYMFEGESVFAIYRVDRPLSYFLRGKGRIVSASPNRVELADVEPENGAVVVSLHWLDTWKSDPPLPLRPESAAPDPVDFVRIEMPGPVRSIVLTNGYDRGR